MIAQALTFFLAFAFSHSCIAGNEPSQCYGTVSNGSLENGVKLPVSGSNFSAYSTLGATLGRTWVHSRVADIVTASYAALERQDPTLHFVYGETGWASGGRIRPHRTHQNGTSVDFFVPVRNAQGQSVALPTGMMQKWGYAIEFDEAGRFGEYSINFAAMAEHLFQLHQQARERGAGIALVIFEHDYLPRLFATPRGAWLR